jgi:hypothetical protein
VSQYIALSRASSLHSLDALLLELLGGLDTLPGRSNLDEDTVLGDAGLLVELDELVGLLDGSLGVERVDGVNLGRDTARDNGEDGRAELDEEAVSGSADLGLEVAVPSAVYSSALCR